MSQPVVVSDSGPLIALAGCGQLDLLVAVFETVHVPQVVLDETTADRSRPGAVDIVDFVQARVQVHPNRSDAIYVASIAHLDEGEAQALSLARALGCGVLMDERPVAVRPPYVRACPCSVCLACCCEPSASGSWNALRPRWRGCRPMATAFRNPSSMRL